MYCATVSLFHFLILFKCLDKVTEWKRLDSGDNTVLSGLLKEVPSLGELGSPLQVDLFSGLAGFLLCSLVGYLTGKNLLLALGLADVLNANVDTLLKDTSIDKLVYTYPNSRLGYVEHDSGTSVVMLVWHTLVDRRISENINIVTNLYVHQVLRKMDGSMLPEFLGKHVPGAGAGSV